MITKGVLSPLGEVDTVPDGKHAVEAVVKKRYDLIIMDVFMPSLNGFEATKLIRHTLPENEQPIIVALTADSTAECKQNCLDSGMNDVLVKPVQISALREVVQKHLTL